MGAADSPTLRGLIAGLKEHFAGRSCRNRVRIAWRGDSAKTPRTIRKEHGSHELPATGTQAVPAGVSSLHGTVAAATSGLSDQVFPQVMSESPAQSMTRCHPKRTRSGMRTPAWPTGQPTNLTRRWTPIFPQVMSRGTSGRMNQYRPQRSRKETKCKVNSRPWTWCGQCPHLLGKTTGHLAGPPRDRKKRNTAKKSQEIPAQVMSTQLRDMDG